MEILLDQQLFKGILTDIYKIEYRCFCHEIVFDKT